MDPRTELPDRDVGAPRARVALANLEEIKSEAGIDSIYLRDAALEVDTGLHDSSERFRPDQRMVGYRLPHGLEFGVRTNLIVRPAEDPDQVIVSTTW